MSTQDCIERERERERESTEQRAPLLTFSVYRRHKMQGIHIVSSPLSEMTTLVLGTPLCFPSASIL